MLNLRHYFLQLQVGTEKNKGERDGGGGGGGRGGPNKRERRRNKRVGNISTK